MSVGEWWEEPARQACPPEVDLPPDADGPKDNEQRSLHYRVGEGIHWRWEDFDEDSLNPLCDWDQDFLEVWKAVAPASRSRDSGFSPSP